MVYRESVVADFEKCGGLIPVVVQDTESKDVLMFAYANREALLLTLSTGKAWFYSRSRQSLWLKGETSGNILLISEVRIDCDLDALLYFVSNQGKAACHEGYRTCFYRVFRGERWITFLDRV